MHRLLGLLGLTLCVGLAGAAHAQTLDKLTGQKIACINGSAASFSCSGVDLMAFLPAGDIGGNGKLNDIWGWTDPETDREYALVGRRDGTAFVDVTDAVNPLFLGVLPTTEGTCPNGCIWRDIKVYSNHAFIVADGAGPNHGMQVFDLTQLRDVSGAPVTFTEAAHYDGMGSAHNIVINEDTGYAYIVGSNSGGDTCGGGLHMVNIQTPTSPVFEGCHKDTLIGRGTGYTHDAQCVVYHGPDTEHQGKEICMGANVDAISISDVSDKTNMDDANLCVSCVVLARSSYPNVGYAHQGWLTEDHQYFVLNDEADEANFNGTRTLIWDVTDLDDPILIEEHIGSTKAIDHNLYVVRNLVIQANYHSGIRILDIADINNPREVAFFDTYPANDNPGFSGAWSVFPFFRSGTLIASGIGEGLFVIATTTVQVATEEANDVPTTFMLSAAYPNPFNPTTTLMLTVDQTQPLRVAAYDLLGREVALLLDGVVAVGTQTLQFEASDLPSGTYLIRATGTTTQTQLVTLAK